MALTIQFLNNHIATWEAALAARPYRQKWPSRLFHHAPIENAVQILNDGNLRSRHDPQNGRPRDVAAAGVIENRLHAHDFARFYFRPRTPTQWHIEGIRKVEDSAYNAGAHAPILIMFVFDARVVLTQAGVHFCDRNMQLGAAIPSDTEQYFSNIPFEKVFHDSGTGGDRSITDHRCAEVLATSPLRLDGALQWIYCRTTAERETLIFMLGEEARAWAPRILISDDLLVFERRYAFVEEVSLGPGGVYVRLNPRRDGRTVAAEVRAWNSRGELVLDFRNPEMAPTPPFPHRGWLISRQFENGTYMVEVWLEGQLAYRHPQVLGANVFL